MAKKTEPVYIRLTPLMNEEIEKSAAKTQENKSEWIRKAIELRLEKEKKVNK